MARTERSIINWCKPNKQGIARLDCFFDNNEGKYFITQESVDLAIKELQSQIQRQQGTREMSTSESSRSGSESTQNSSDTSSHHQAEDRETRNRLRDLEVTNMVKDQVIERLEADRDKLLDQVVTSSHRIGELETQLLQLQAPEQPRINRSLTSESSKDQDLRVGNGEVSTASEASDGSTEYNHSYGEERA